MNKRVGSGPVRVTSRRRIIYRESTWRVHQFEVWSEELLCNAAAMRMKDSVLVWVGSGSGGAAQLSEVCVGVPGLRDKGPLVTGLVGGGGGDADCWAVSLCRRLTSLLRHPVFLCCGVAFNRFSSPLIERGLIAEIKNRPECF